MFGTFLGAILIGYLSDLFGRKLGVALALIFVWIGGTASSVSPYYPLYLFFRFVTGLGGAGLFMIAFIIGNIIIVTTSQSNFTNCINLLA